MNQSQALDDTSAALALIDPWLRAHLPALDAAVTRRFVQLVTGSFEQRSLLLSTIAERTAFAGADSSNATQVRRIIRDARISLNDVFYPLLQELIVELPNEVLYLTMDETSHHTDYCVVQVGLAPRIKKLAIWEPAYILDDSRPPAPRDYKARLTELLSSGRRGDMVELFMTQAVGMPVEIVAQMRQAPWWPFQEALSHTLIYNAEIMGDFSLPTERVASVTVPTLVMDGGTTPWLTHAAQAVADALPNAQRRTLAGQPHNVAPEAMAPVLVLLWISGCCSAWAFTR
jgi:pimeloyl-ACP methyl ester carboxylesterase